MICKLSTFCRLGTLQDLHWWPILCLTAHKPKQITCRGSAHVASACPHKGIKYIERSGYFKRWFRLPAVGETTGRSWHGGRSETLLRHFQASQRTTGKSTWMQGMSSFIIPWRDTKEIIIIWTDYTKSCCWWVKPYFRDYNLLTWGVRFFWILFSLAFLRPFFVTIVSS